MSNRIGIMRPIPFDQEKFEAMPKPVIVQPKLEGDRMRAVPYIPNPPHSILFNLLSSQANERVSVPHIKQALINMGADIEMDGELFVPGMRHSEIRSIVSRTKNLHSNYRAMEYHIYDVVTSHPQWVRLAMQHKLPIQGPIKLVPYYYCHNIKQLQKFYDIFLNQNYEGIIVRDQYQPYERKQVKWMMKLKPRLSGIFKILNVLPLEDQYGVIHDLMGAFVLQDSEGRIFNVGSGPKASDRQLFWTYRKSLICMDCKIRFQGYTKINHVPKMQSIDKKWLTSMRKLFKEV